MNRTELNVELERRGENYSHLAKAAKISYSAVINKLNGRSNFTLPELRNIKNAWELTNDRFCEIFFAG